MTRLDPAFLRIPLAHRTLHDVSNGRPENSVEGAIAAIDAGYGIEIDLQLSSDDQAMVFHDYDLKRLTGKSGLVTDHKATDLSKIPLLGGKEGIPRFDAFLELINGQVPLLVELKPQNQELGPEADTMAMAVKTAAEAYKGPIAFMSFNPFMMRQIKKALPNASVGLVTDPFDPKIWPEVSEDRCATLRGIPDYNDLGASFISHNMHDLSAQSVSNIAKKGGHILCWTVKSPKDEVLARQVAQNITFEKYLAAQ